MLKGHVTGHKKEKKDAQAWYAALEEANIRKVEAEWQAKQQAQAVAWGLQEGSLEALTHGHRHEKDNTDVRIYRQPFSHSPTGYRD